MAEEWIPEAGDLSLLIKIIKKCQNPATQSKNDMAWLRNPNKSKLLMFVMANTNEDTETRSQCGLLLKYFVRKHVDNIDPGVINYIQSKCLLLLHNASPEIRGTTGSLVSMIVSKLGLEKWPELNTQLVRMLASPLSSVCYNGLDLLKKVLEDCTSTELDKGLLIPLVPYLLQLMQDNSVQKLHALLCLEQFFVRQIPISMEHTDAFLVTLMKLACYNDAEIKTNVSRCWTILLNFRIDLRDSNMMVEITKLMLVQIEDDDEKVALQALEFWLALAQKSFCKDILSNPLLERLLESLVNRLRLTKKEIGRLNRDSEDENDLFLNFAFSEWSSRKCSAAVLEQLGKTYKDDLPPVLLRDSFKDKFRQGDWEDKEAVILAQGLISECCMKGMETARPNLVPWLVSRLWNEMAGSVTVPALLRSSTCWTIGRYAHLVVGQSDTLSTVIDALLKMMLEKDKRVQAAACAALALIEVEAGEQLAPHLTDIMRTIHKAFGEYGKKNVTILLDCVGALANSVGRKLNRPSYTDLIVTQLIEKWNDLTSLENEDQHLLPLLKCLSSVVTAIQLNFLPDGETVFPRCVSIIKRTLDQLNENESPELDFMILSLDLLSRLTEELGSEIEPHISPSNLMQLLLDSMKYPYPEVLQFAFGLLGALTKICFQHVFPFIRQIVTILEANLKPELPSVCSNAIWVLGEIAVKMGVGMAKYLVPIHFHGTVGNKTPLIDIMNRPGTQKSLLENTDLNDCFKAITLGRLGWICTPILSLDLPHFARQWCITMCGVPDGDEKNTAWRGMCNMIVANPDGINRDLFFFCYAVATWKAPPADLRHQFKKILRDFKSGVSNDNWTQFIHQQPLDRQKFWKLYGV